MNCSGNSERGRDRFICTWSARTPWNGRVISDTAFAIAHRADRNPARCWMRLALWAMGVEGYPLRDEIDPGCTWCGKCQPRVAKKVSDA